jgi:undecaprenyl diphosphate synthase
MTASPPAELPRIPAHVAIIMDGNGRWATSRGLTRLEGHKNGADAVRRTVEAAKELGVKYLTLFGFSSENWSRPEQEVDGLMNLLRFYLKKETAEMQKAGVRMRIIGDRTKLASDIVKLIEHAENVTRDNTEVTVIVALSYGGRQDIAFAAQAAARRVATGEIKPEDITEAVFAEGLMTKGIPDPDLMIRTSGEKRISNFLMWQSAYTEFYFTETLWPDFARADMEAALAFYAGRDRRYGKLRETK